ncbi:MAG: hypothetical protein V7K35_15980 [Nostoc sp.]|uniref:hypothetical protein n=1 Tax=Nostoc sp. TaxID=1180 RepID=UPI002FFABBEF
MTISGLLLPTVKIQAQTSRNFSSMKTSTKIILVAAFVGTLGLAELSKVVSAKQPQSFVAIARQHHSVRTYAKIAKKLNLSNRQDAKSAENS